MGENMDQPCHQAHLTALAQELTQWEVVALALGLKEAEVDEVEGSGRSLPERRIKMLLKWKSKYHGRATYRRLYECLSTLKRSDLAEKVRELSCTPALAVNKALAEHIKTFYKNADEKMRRSFMCNITSVRSVPKQFFKLVIVKGEIADMDGESVRTLPMMGRMNEVASRRDPIELVDIFKDGIENKTVLIEGAPGSGKSSLLWHSCQLWRIGELFLDFNYVIYVLLRNPDVQKATSIADLIPCKKEIAVSILEEIEYVEGKGVLFLLDGWDELPVRLQHESLIWDILNRSPKCGVNLCSVVVTSRHNSDDDLYSVRTSHLEIVGFTEDEAKKCMEDLLSDHPGSTPLLLESLQASPSLMCCCYLPLNVVIIVNVFLLLGHQLPSTMLNIFQALICNCILRHIKKYFPDCGVRSIKSLDELPQCVEKAFQHLCCLAFQSLERGQVVFTEEEVGQECDKLSLLQEAMCFEVAGTSLRYNFLHLTIQELLAAIHMSKMSVKDQVDTTRRAYYKEQFSTVLQFYAGITSFRHPEVVEAFYYMLNSSTNDKDKKYMNVAIGDYEDKHCSETENTIEASSTLFKTIEKHSSFGREFVLASNCLYESDSKTSALYKHFSRSNFKIANIPLTPYDCLALGCLMVKAESIQAVNFWNCNLGELCVKYLCNGLKQNFKELKVELRIAGPGTDETCIKILSELLRNNFYLSPIGCNIGANGLKYYVESLLSSAGTDTIVNIQYCNVVVNATNGPLLQKLIASRLVQLDLRGNPGVGAGAHFIGLGLKHTTTLQYLCLRKCNLTSAAAKKIAKGLKVNKSLLQVTMSGNKICDEGAESIGLALAHNTTLKILDMSLCHLTVEGMKTLTSRLVEYHKVEQLDLFGGSNDSFPFDLMERRIKKKISSSKSLVSPRTKKKCSQALDLLQQMKQYPTLEIQQQYMHLIKQLGY